MKIIQKNYGAKLSVFLCWCQIVRFYYVGVKLSVCLLGAKLPGAKLSGAKLSGAKLFYHECYSTLMVFLSNRIVPVEPSWFRMLMSPLSGDCLSSRWSTLGTKYRGTETKIRKCECKNKWQTSWEARLAKPAMLVSEPHLCVEKYNLKYTYLFTCVWTRVSLRHLSEVWTLMAHWPTHVVVANIP